ncbi:MAG: glycosyltransferase family 2 protein [Chitinispirillaceae bacterium]
MGKVSFHTGSRLIRVGIIDRIILLLLVTIGIEAALYYADYWFFGGHRKHLVLFILLSYAIFRGVARSIFSWVVMLFVSLPDNKRLKRDLSVDVITTAMPGEPYEMFEKTLTAIAEMDYPHTSWLLDGGNDPKLQALCIRLGINHIDCRGIEGAKAGKVNHCLENHATGEFVLIIDPDHIPNRDFLESVLPQFNDRRVGFVQVVQAYYNVNRSYVSRAAAEHTYGFYGPNMMGLNGLGIPTAIGANCVFRRAALDSIGGHAVSLAEDANTSLRLHAKGWKSVYVPYRASYGLVPEDMDTFFKQQLKWSKGMFSLFFGDYRKLFTRLPLPAKLQYFFAGTHYLNGFVTLLTILLPIVFLFTKVFAIEMPFDEFAIHLLPYVIISVVINMYVQRWYTDRSEFGIPWRTMLFERGTWYIYFLGLLYAITGKKVLYLPTPKKAKTGRCLNLVAPHIVAVVLSASAILFAFLTYPRIDGGTVLMMFFAGLNIVTLTPIIALGIWNPKWESEKESIEELVPETAVAIEPVGR